MIDLPQFYRDLESAARSAGFTIDSLGSVGGFELPFLHRTGTSPEKRIYLSSGVHGDEPAGPLALLEALRTDSLPREASLSLFPMINPTGHQTGRRENANGADLNRDFRHARQPETQLMRRHLDPRPPYELSVCLHEDWESTGFYLYATGPELPPEIARATLAAVAQRSPIDLSDEIDGKPARDGLIQLPEDFAAAVEERDDWPEAMYLYHRKPHRHFTTESASSEPIADRVRAQLAALSTILRLA